MAEPAAQGALGEDEAGLVRAVLAGERAALERLMRTYNRRLYRIARAVLRDPAEAEDALQEAYLSALKALPRFRGESSLSTWLSRVIFRECLGRLRRSARRQQSVPIAGSILPEEARAVADESERPDQILARAQVRELLERKLDALPEVFRVVFVLRGVEGLSVAETAESLGLPEATVRTRLFRARQLLRESLAEEFDGAARDAFDFAGERCDRIVAWVVRQFAAKSPTSG